jgi:UDP-N-acetylmuramate dehydrogenase
VTRDAFVSAWRARLGPARWQTSAPLAPLTTFKVGGGAEVLVDLHSERELTDLVADAARAGVAVTPLGGGSNVLVSDAGVAGVVARLHFTTIDEMSPSLVRAGAGVTINGLVRWTIGRGLAALEAWAGTPGTVGGAIYGNAHWAGQNIGDLVTTVKLVDRAGRPSLVPRSEMGFAYDTSRLQRTGEIVVWGEFAVAYAEPALLRERARASLHYRKATQPLALPSAGCIFQNPTLDEPWPEGVPRSAGAIIDRAGLKGAREGGAKISDRHANFIVNDAGATAEHVYRLIERARRVVRETFGVELRHEVVFLGTFDHG